MFSNEDIDRALVSNNFVYDGDIEQISDEHLVVLRERFEALALDILAVLQNPSRMEVQPQKPNQLIILRQLVLFQIAEYFRVELDSGELIEMATNHQGDFGSLVDVAVITIRQRLVKARVVEKYQLDHEPELVEYVQRALETIEAVRNLMHGQQVAYEPERNILYDLIVGSTIDDDHVNDLGNPPISKRILKVQSVTPEELRWMEQYYATA